MDARVISALARVFDALLPAHDDKDNAPSEPWRLPVRQDRAKATAAILFGREVVTFSWRK
jgi:hypothetical protein